MPDMRERADKVLFQQGLSRSRNEARMMIERGDVFWDNRPIASAHALIPLDAKIEIRNNPSYASRGAEKLIAALDHFAIDPKGMIALDLGISTGGFTDILIRRGAKKIYGIDVGEGQLSPKLNHHPVLIHMEETNARNLTPLLIPDPIDLITCDVSFISLKLALPAALALAKPKAYLIVLIKPQFEVGQDALGKKGIVRDPLLHEKVCTDISHWLNAQHWKVLGLIESPILGGSGNKEFLVAAQNH